ncbi:MAG: hypothetical protein H6685_13935 [Deltaproteobacteria bacterium]|nr:hypothetical protein [Deltaproteobacteria bacterium]
MLSRTMIGVWALLFGLSALGILPLACGDDDDDDGVLAENPNPSGSGDTSDDDDDTTDDDTSDDDDDGVKTAFVVYPQGDVAEGNDFANFIERNSDFETVLIVETALDSANLASADVFVLTPDTQWFSPADYDAIHESNIPALAVGEGGSLFLAAVGSQIGYDDVVFSSEKQVRVEDASHEIFTEPNDLDVVDGETFSVMSDLTALYPPVTDDPSNSGVSTLATPVSNTARGAIAFESRGYMNFGFDFETDNLTGLGADLFINCLEFLVTQ